MALHEAATNLNACEGMIRVAAIDDENSTKETRLRPVDVEAIVPEVGKLLFYKLGIKGAAGNRVHMRSSRHQSCRNYAMTWNP